MPLRCGITRSMGVWEHLWEDSAANQTLFAAEKDTVRGMVSSFMEEFPAVGRTGSAVTGEAGEDESAQWDEGMKKKRAEMEAAVAAAKEKKKSALEEAAAGGAAEDAAPAAAAAATA